MGWTLRQRAATVAAAAMVAALAVLDACSGSGATVAVPTPTPSPPEATPRPTPTAPVSSPTPGPSPTPAVVEPAPTPAAAETPLAPALTGFVYPIDGACLPTSDNLMPNAPRTYRAGIHEGIDFYPGLSCAPIAEGTPVLAAKAGVVIRADWTFVDVTPEELDQLLTRSQTQGYTDAEALDRFRGRQVWIDHGAGVVTRYAHLGGIAPAIGVGTAVQAGEVVGYVGESGTPEAVTAPGTEMHLHFEIRVGDSYLGAGLPPDQARALLEQVFSGP